MDPHSLVYQLKCTCLLDVQVQYISSFLEEWTRSRGLLQGKKKFISLIATYLKHCCPEGIDDAGLRLLGEYLVVYYELYVTFHDASLETSFYAGMVSVLMEVLRGGKGGTSMPFDDAAASLGADLESYARRGLSREPFLRRLEEMFDAFVWNRGLPGGAVVHPDVFWGKRVHLVSQLPYVELCNLVVGNHTENIPGEAETLDTLAAEITFLANEVGSMTRDFATDHRQNLVKSFIVHKHWSLEDTLAKFVEWHNEKQPEMRRLLGDRVARSRDPSVLIRHAEIQEIVTHGCFHSMLELRNRYSFVAAHLGHSASCCKALYFSEPVTTL